MQHQTGTMKRILSLFLVIAMLATMITIPSFADSTLSGAGTTADPYQIGTAAQLTYARGKINSDASYASASYILTANINMGNAEWASIGTDSKPFSGTFFGNNKTISALAVTNDDSEVAGLFGHVTGTVKDLTLSGINVNIADPAGSELMFAGMVAVNDGTFENCTLTASSVQAGDSWTGSVQIGGFAASGNGSLKNCTVSSTTVEYLGDEADTGVFYGYSISGKIKGGVATNVTLTNTTSTIDNAFNGKGNNGAGLTYTGLVINGAAPVSGTLVSNPVKMYTAPSYNIVEGTAVLDGELDDAYWSSAMIAKTDYQEQNDDIADIDFVTFMLADATHLYMITAVEDNDVQDEEEVRFFINWGTFTTVTVNHDGTVTVGDEGAKAKKVKAAVLDTAYGYNVEICITLPTTNLNTTGRDFKYHTWITNYDQYGDSEGFMAGNFFSTTFTLGTISATDVFTGFTVGSGSSNNPYEIASVDALAFLNEMIAAGATNPQGKAYSDCCYYLSADIDWDNDPWTPINLNGTFDGRGHTISNVNINATINDKLSCGFFGKIGNNGGVSNLGLKNVAMAPSSFSNVCAIAPFVAGNDGFIENCYVDGASVTTTNDNQFGLQIGGFAGAGNGSFTNCYANNVTITATGLADGHGIFAGFHAYNATSEAVITNCYIANITISGASSQFGGIFANNEGVTVEDSFYYNVVINDAAAQTSAGYVNTTAYILNTLGWSADVWNVVAGQLPTLKATSVEIINFAGGNGTIGNPYQISNVAQLNLMKTFINSNEPGFSAAAYILTADIDLNGEDWYPIGVGTYGSENDKHEIVFGGRFDGNGHTISNFTMTKAYNSFYCGFFTQVAKDAVVCNVCFSDVTIASAASGNMNRVGVVAGSLSGTFSNILVVDSTVTACNENAPWGQFAGALTGSSGGTISNCMVANTTVTLAEGCVDYAIGALVGNSNVASAVVDHCFAYNVALNFNDPDRMTNEVYGYHDADGDGDGAYFEDNMFASVSLNGGEAYNSENYTTDEDYFYDEMLFDDGIWGFDVIPYLAEYDRPELADSLYDFTLVVSGPASVSAGETVTYTFTVTDIESVLSLDFKVPYDTSVLTFVDGSVTSNKPNANWDVSANASEGVVNVFCADNMITTPAADFYVTLSFTVANNVAAGTKIVIAPASGVDAPTGSDASADLINGTSTSFTSTVAAATFTLINNSTLVLADGILYVPAGYTVAQVQAQFTSAVTLTSAGTGNTVSNGAGSAVIVMAGDLNGNGTIESNDAILLRSLFLGVATNGLVETYGALAADVNDNGVIESNDYMNIRSIILGK